MQVIGSRLPLHKRFGRAFPPGLTGINEFNPTESIKSPFECPLDPPHSILANEIRYRTGDSARVGPENSCRRVTRVMRFESSPRPTRATGPA